MTTTRTCVPEFVIRWMEEYKKNNGWKFGGPFSIAFYHQEKDDFSMMFDSVGGFDQFYPRCKMAYNHPDMRQILEM